LSYFHYDLAPRQARGTTAMACNGELAPSVTDNGITAPKQIGGDSPSRATLTDHDTPAEKHMKRPGLAAIETIDEKIVASWHPARRC
jgi:hypothetical protein